MKSAVFSGPELRNILKRKQKRKKKRAYNYEKGDCIVGMNFFGDASVDSTFHLT
jgi:hypothetical protein